MGSERRGRAVHGRLEVNPSGEEPTDRPRQKNAGLWEPYDGRLSRTVLREREGEVPSRHSPGTHTQSDRRVSGTISLRLLRSVIPLLIAKSQMREPLERDS